MSRVGTKRKFSGPVFKNKLAREAAQEKKEAFWNLNDEEINESEAQDREYKEKKEDVTTQIEETAEEKRLRLAQEYIKKLGGEESDEGSDAEERISNQLTQQADQIKGKRILRYADQLVGVDPSSLSITRMRGHQLSITSVALSSDDTFACSASKDSNIIKWDLETCKKIFTFEGRRGQKNPTTEKNKNGHVGHVLALAISSDGRFLASGGADSTLKIWDIRSNTFIDAFSGHRGIVSALSFQVGTHQLYSGSHDRTVKIWNIDDMSYVDSLFGHQSEVVCMDSLSKDRAISSSLDSSIRLWKIVEETQLVFRGHSSYIDCVSLQTEDTFLSGSQDGSLAFWSTQKKKPVQLIKDAHVDNFGRTCWVTSVAACKYSNLTASGSHNGSIKLWKGCGFPNSQIMEIPMEGFVNSMAFSNSGKFLLAGIGQEHRLGRWSTIKTAKNCIQLIKLPVTSE